jgi:hypothetical protein
MIHRVSEMLDRIAAKRLTKRRARIERQRLISTTNRLLAEMGLPPDTRLRA